MTEKRFILVEYVNKGLFIQDNANDETQYFQGSKASLEKVVDLLNSLNGENEQLKKDCTALVYHNQGYRKENELLQHKLSQQEMEYATTAHRQAEENEQLRQRNTNQYNQLTELWEIIEEEDWEKLIAMKKQLKEDEERLRNEWRCYE